MYSFEPKFEYEPRTFRKTELKRVLVRLPNPEMQKQSSRVRGTYLNHELWNNNTTVNAFQVNRACATDLVSSSPIHELKMRPLYVIPSTHVPRNCFCLTGDILVHTVFRFSDGFLICLCGAAFYFVCVL